MLCLKVEVLLLKVARARSRGANPLFYMWSGRMLLMKGASGQEWGSWCYRWSGMLLLLEVLELLICVLSILQLLLQLLLSSPLYNIHKVSVLALDFLIS